MFAQEAIEGAIVVKNIAYRPGAGKSNEGDLYLPQKAAKAKAILLIHGGGWNSMDRNRFKGVSAFLAENGYAVFNIDYRLLPEASYPGCEEDCLAAANFLLNAGHPELKQLSLEKIVIAGGSAGGQLALMTGLKLPDERVAGIIDLSGPTDLTAPEVQTLQKLCKLFEGHGGEELIELQKLASPVFIPSEKLPPLLILHCCQDSVVAFQQALRLEEFWNRGGGALQAFYYNGDAKNGHDIWRKEEVTPRLYEMLERQILAFLQTYHPD